MSTAAAARRFGSRSAGGAIISHPSRARRWFFAGAGGLLALAACERGVSDAARPTAAAQASAEATGDPSGGAPAPRVPPGVTASEAPEGVASPGERVSRAPRVLEWSFRRGPFGPTDVVISVPDAPEGRRFPVLVAFHGRGESLKGSRRGARGWLDDYALERAMSRLAAPPLVREDFELFVSDERASALNALLRERPYAGLIVVCPFLPDVLKGARAFAEAAPLADFVVDVLLPRVYAKTPAIGSAATTGIDGVSLGGRASLLVGLRRATAFHSVGALQAALDMKELPRFAELAVAAHRDNPSLVLRLLTSDEDYFLDVNQGLSASLKARGVPHELTQVTGTHSYRFNRGPGSIEMLLFHDRILWEPVKR